MATSSPLPLKHTATGWWLEEAGADAARPSLEGGHDVDVVVIGGGYTGLWTAWHLLELEPAARVAILEADLCGHGPSGRNGGFCESLWLRVPALRARLGDAGARAVAEESSRSVEAIRRWCREQGVDAWFDQSGYLLASTAPAHDAVVRREVDAAAAVGAPERVVPLDEVALRARCDPPVLRGGGLVPDFATVHPARLALGLRAGAPPGGPPVSKRFGVPR